MHPRLSVVAAVVVFLVTGCSATSNVDSDGRPAPAAIVEDVVPELFFAYSGKASAGLIDQTITITNFDITRAVVPIVSYVAVDADGNELEDVSVETVYGSDRGRVVAPANVDVLDILRFTGTGVGRVDDVVATVESADTLADAGSIGPEVDYLVDGTSVPTPFEASAVEVSNPGAQDYLVRLVGIRWAVPDPGQSQQSSASVDLTDAVPVAAGESVTIDLPPNQRGRFDSIKSYIAAR